MRTSTIRIGQRVYLGCLPLLRFVHVRRIHIGTPSRHPKVHRVARFPCGVSLTLTGVEGIPRKVQAAGRAATEAARWRPGQRTSEGTYQVARTLHRHTRGRSSRLGLRALRLLHERHDPPSSADLTPEWRSALATLQTEGVSFAPSVLGAEAIARLTDFARSAPAVLRSIDGKTRYGTFRDRDASTAGVAIVERFVLDNPDIQGLLVNSDVLSFAAARFQATPVVHPPQLYWSLAGAQVTDSERRQGARQFHWDYDGLAGIRLHVYLTDVDDGSAPMSYIAGSNNPGSLGSRALRMGDLGVPDDVLWARFPRSALRTMTGPSGTTFVSDSQGLHSGSDAVSNDRLFLVMPIQATGFASYQLQPRPIAPKHPELVAALGAGRQELTFFQAR